MPHIIRTTMEGGMDVHLGGKEGAAVGSLPKTLAGIAAELQQEQHGWLERLLRDPAHFGDIEVTVHHTFQRHADQVVASLLGEVGQAPVLEQASKKSR